MPGKAYICLLLAWTWSQQSLDAQQAPSTLQQMEDLLYRDEASIIPEQVLELYERTESGPIYLNRATEEQLEDSGLFTSYQLYQLIRYREKYGVIYSIYELLAIPGFRESKVHELVPFLVLTSGITPPGKKSLRQMVLADVGKTWPQKSNLYAGSPLKTTLRIRSQPFNKLSIGLTYEKDAGEEILYEKKPQFLSAYLSYKGSGHLKHLVIGNFRMNHGLGLVNGTGFMHQPGDFRVGPQSLSRLIPYASKTESDFEQGLACHMAKGQFQVQLWASYRRLDLSPVVLTDSQNTSSWWEQQRSTGLYRSENEIEGRDLATRAASGIQFLYRHHQLTLGILSNTEWIGPSRKAMQYMDENPDAAIKQTASIHGNWQLEKIQLFGELSTRQFQSMACLLGTSCHFNDFVQGGLMIHSYAEDYRGSLPSTYASGSKIENEKGIAFHLHLEPGRLLLARLSAEWFHYPKPRYLTEVPSQGYRFDLTMHNPRTNQLQWRIRLVHKSWQTTPLLTTTKLRPLQDSRLSRLDCRLICKLMDELTWQSRFVVSAFSSQQESSPGYAAVQQLNIHITPHLKSTFQFVNFQVNEWNNRIYIYEPGLYYSFNFPAYYGRGHKTTALLSLVPKKGITLSAKINSITYYDRDPIENRKWETAVQLRLTF